MIARFQTATRPARPALARFAVALVIASLACPLNAQLNKPEGSAFLGAIKESKREEVLAFLERAGPTPINARDGDTGDSALHIVVRRRDDAYLAYLIGKKANLDVQNNKGETPLLLATRGGQPELVTMLAKAGANIDLGDTSGQTPLIQAILRRNVDMVRTLLDLGADPDRKDLLQGFSARDYAHDDKRSPTIAQMIDAQPRKTRRAVSGPSL